MTSISGIVQFVLEKSLAVWGDIEIYADSIGIVETFIWHEYKAEAFVVAMLWFVRLLFPKKKLLGKRS